MSADGPGTRERTKWSSAAIFALTCLAVAVAGLLVVVCTSALTGMDPNVNFVKFGSRGGGRESAFSAAKSLKTLSGTIEEPTPAAATKSEQSTAISHTGGGGGGGGGRDELLTSPTSAPPSSAPYGVSETRGRDERTAEEEREEERGR